MSPVTIDFDVRPCITGAALSAVPKREVMLDFSAVKRNFEVVIDAKLLIIIRVQGEEIIVHSNGELKFKTLKDKERIRRIAELVYSKAALGLAAGGRDHGD